MEKLFSLLSEAVQVNKFVWEKTGCYNITNGESVISNHPSCDMLPTSQKRSEFKIDFARFQ